MSKRVLNSRVLLSSGTLAEWNKTYGGQWSDYVRSIVQTSDGGYAFAGATYSFGAGDSDMWLVKTGDYGNVDWNRTYGGVELDAATCVQQTMDGGYIVAGGWDDFWLVKTDTDGNVEWIRAYGGSKMDNAYCVQQTCDGGYVVAGDTESFGYGRDGSPDAWVIKFFPSHDVAVESVESSKSVVGLNYSLYVDVTVRNLGFFPETFNVTL